MFAAQATRVPARKEVKCLWKGKRNGKFKFCVMTICLLFPFYVSFIALKLLLNNFLMNEDEEDDWHLNGIKWIFLFLSCCSIDFPFFSFPFFCNAIRWKTFQTQKMWTGYKVNFFITEIELFLVSLLCRCYGAMQIGFSFFFHSNNCEDWH